MRGTVRPSVVVSRGTLSMHTKVTQLQVLG